MKNKIIEELNNKRILILGFGIEGKSAYDFIKNNVSFQELAIADKKFINQEDDVKVFWGENYLDSVKDYDVVIKSPGVVIKDYVSVDDKKKIVSLTSLFLKFCPCKIVGITGTKGKSTTSSLIYHILKDNGVDTYLIGNIGVPCFDVIDKVKDTTVIVYELSCHQLEFVTNSPHISVLLNLYQEHLDHYNSVEDYINAKKNIYKYQHEDDYLIYGDVNQYMSLEELSDIKSKKISIFDYDKVSYDEIKTSLIGKHNKDNIITSLIVCEILGLDKNDILKSVESFKGLEHRLEYVGRFYNIDFYNDTIATACEAVINAVNAIGNVGTLIVGGMDRGIDYLPLVSFLNESNVDNIILLPDTNKRIKDLFGETDKKLYMVNDMAEAVDVAFSVTGENTACLLSPAAASYGFYTNFEKRGEHFKELVTSYEK